MASEKQLNARQQQKTDTYANWETAGKNGFIPKKGEIIVYQEKGDNKSKIKIGDGSTKVHELPFTEGQPSGGSLSATDDGNGNVIITITGGISVTDDGNGNVVLT